MSSSLGRENCGAWDMPVKPHPSIPLAWTGACKCGYGFVADSPEAAVMALGHHLRYSGPSGAFLALADLREALATIRLPSPAYAPGTEPTGADVCGRILQMIEHGLHQIEVFVG